MNPGTACIVGDNWRVNQKQAFWEALAVVVIPSLLLGSVLWFWVRPAGTEWPIYLGVFLVPTLLLLPLVYGKYRRTAQPGQPKRRQLAGVLFLIAGAGYAVDAFLSDGDKWRVLLRFAFAIMWFALGATFLLRTSPRKLADATAETQNAD